MIKSKSQGLLIVISAPSGAGKGTIISEVKKMNPSLWVSVSATTREPRSNDEEGVTYYFHERSDFEEKIKEDYFLEYAEYAGNLYGTPREHIQKHLNNGEDVVLEIEIQGAMQVKELLPEALFVFIMPPSLKELKQRLKGRQTDTQKKILERFKIAYKEMNDVTKYNYVVINDDIDVAAAKVDAIIKAEKCRVDRIEEMFLNNEEEYMHEMLLEDEEFDNSLMEI